jgi:UDP-glucose 4-epimerase
MKKLLLTGASGFVGQNFLKIFSKNDEYQIIAFDRAKDLSDQLKNIDVIVHAAGLAHSPHIQDRGSYIKGNFELTKQLAIAARNTGVKTFIFLSTIKVLGEYNLEQNPLLETAPYRPSDFYSESKVMAEEFLKQYWSNGLVILRPVVIYGPQVKGNFKTLAKFSHLPLPLAGIKAKRSILFVGNLIQTIEQYLNFENKLHFQNCADTNALTISEILNLMAQAQNKKSRCFYFPEFLLRLGLNLLGKSSVVDRLMRDFIVANSYPTQDHYQQAEAFKISFGDHS